MSQPDYTDPVCMAMLLGALLKTMSTNMPNMQFAIVGMPKDGARADSVVLMSGIPKTEMIAIARGIIDHAAKDMPLEPVVVH